MPGLEDGGVVFLAADEELGGVYLADVEDGVDGDLDWAGSAAGRWGGTGQNVLNSVSPRTVSVVRQRMRGRGERGGRNTHG